MDPELIGKVSQLEQKLDGLIKPEVSRQLVAPFLDMSGKVGLWYAGDVQRSTGNIYDTSGQGRTLTYSVTGNQIFKQLDNGIAYVDLDGTGDYFSRADETDLDVLGTEAHNVGGSPGLTIGGWFWPDEAANDTFMGKSLVAGNQRAYVLQIASGLDVRFALSNGGSTVDAQAASSAITTGAWYFCVGRMVPSVSADVYVNNVKTSDTSSPIASIFNSSADFAIGARSGGGNALTGRFSIGFLSGNALPDTKINSLFQQTRVFYGV